MVAMVLMLTIAFTGSVMPLRGEVVGKEIADQYNNVNAVKILKVGKNTYHVTKGGKKEIIKIQETKKIRKVIVSDAKNKKKNSVIYDKKTKTVYSTYTKKKVKINDIELFSKTTYKYKYVSYATMRKIAGKVYTVGGLIAVIVACCATGTIAAGVVTAFFYATGLLDKKIPNSKKHGLRFTIKITKYYRRRSKVPYRTTKTVVGIRRY